MRYDKQYTSYDTALKNSMMKVVTFERMGHTVEVWADPVRSSEDVASGVEQEISAAYVRIDGVAANGNQQPPLVDESGLRALEALGEMYAFELATAVGDELKRRMWLTVKDTAVRQLPPVEIPHLNMTAQVALLMASEGQTWHVIFSGDPNLARVLAVDLLGSRLWIYPDEVKEPERWDLP